MNVNIMMELQIKDYITLDDTGCSTDLIRTMSVTCKLLNERCFTPQTSVAKAEIYV
jgi:hypothetical protein